MSQAHSGPESQPQRNNLQDQLSIERTALANERTLLAYLQTALAFGAGGATLIHFRPEPAADQGGWALIGVAVAIALFGVWRYASVRRMLQREREAGLFVPPLSRQEED